MTHRFKIFCQNCQNCQKMGLIYNKGYFFFDKTLDKVIDKGKATFSVLTVLTNKTVDKHIFHTEN